LASGGSQGRRRGLEPERHFVARSRLVPIHFELERRVVHRPTVCAPTRRARESRPFTSCRRLGSNDRRRETTRRASTRPARSHRREESSACGLLPSETPVRELRNWQLLYEAPFHRKSRY